MGDEWQNRIKNNNEAGMEGREEERGGRLITNILDQQQHVVKTQACVASQPHQPSSPPSSSPINMHRAGGFVLRSGLSLSSPLNGPCMFRFYSTSAKVRSSLLPPHSSPLPLHLPLPCTISLVYYRRWDS